MLTFHTGMMNSGKSTLALVTAHSLQEGGINTLLLTRLGRDGQDRVTARTGLTAEAIEVGDDDSIIEVWKNAGQSTHVVIDEAQFLSSAQVEELSWLGDEQFVQIEAFGLLTDFRTKLFEGSQRLVELADDIQKLPVRARCWCGEHASVNARLVGGVIVDDGPVVLVGDVDDPTAEVTYRTLCRTHFRDGLTAAEVQPQIPEVHEQ